MKKLLVLMFIIFFSCDVTDESVETKMPIDDTEIATEEQEPVLTSILLHSGSYSDIQEGSTYVYHPCIVPSEGCDVPFGITNMSTEILIVSSIEVTNAEDYTFTANDFAGISEYPISILPFQCKYFKIWFHPQTIGIRISIVTIVSDDPKYPIFTFILSGEGI